MPSPVYLDHRSIIEVAGAEAEGFLQGLLTCSTNGLVEGAARHGALLTPQGKIIADMLLRRSGHGFLLECDAGISAALAKRLNMFRLRAKVSVAERSDLGVMAFEGEADPRSADAPARKVVAWRMPGDDLREYHAHRIGAGIAEQGIDFRTEEVFPADINMDLLDGVDFKKGCFVGQEVVSRMKRRGTARRRTLVVHVDDVAAPCPVLAVGHEIGTLTSSARGVGLARVRIDRMAEAEAAGEAFSAGGRKVTFVKPDWLDDELKAMAEAKEARG